MTTLVIKEWSASDQPVDGDENLVKISGRAGGLISWLLSLVKIDPTTTIKISNKRMEFSSSSLSGTDHKIIPIKSICSTFYGYHKPWKAALAIFFFVAYISASITGAMDLSGFSAGSIFGGVLLGAIVSVLYYFLSKTLTLGFVEHSGVSSSIKFKRSVIENMNIDQNQARYICELTQYIIQEQENKNPLTQP